MTLDLAQRQTLRTHALSNQATVAVGAGTPTIASLFAGQFLDADAAVAILNWYNQLVSPDYYIVRNDAQIVEIRDAILWGRFTPSVNITSGNAAQATACSNYCMGKATVLQLLLPTTGGTFDATRKTQTAGLKDSTTTLPSAGSFNNQDAGWSGSSTCVANTLVRKARNIEKVFALDAGIPALNDGTTARGGWNLTTGLGNPDTTSFSGSIVIDDVTLAFANA